MLIGKDLQKAVSLLQAGELVAIPTETVYGLAANALDEEAILKIFKAKNRPFFDPLIVHIGHLDQLSAFTQSIPEQALKLAKVFMPGPLTLLLEKKPNISDLVTSGSSRVAVRIPNHPLTQALLEQSNLPLAAPSANPFGYISPTTAQHVAQQLSGKLSYILDGGPSKIGLESTIIGFESGQPIIYRKGGLAIEKIESIIGKVKVKAHSTSNPSSPGQLKSHYAPRTPILIGDLSQLLKEHGGKKIGILSFQKEYNQEDVSLNLVLSSTGDLDEAAKNLFDMMRKMDTAKLDVILAEWVPETQLGRAINDRLKRATV